MINVHRITSKEDPLYPQVMALYAESFPLHEQRLSASQCRILSHPEFHCTALLEDQQFAGLLFFWETDDFRYVEHFAISPALRGQNLGSRALPVLLDGQKPVILEIDPLTTEIAVRRKGFYERLGFCTTPYPHVHPPYCKDFEGHALLVLSYPTAISEAEYQTFSTYLNQVVMKTVF